ncbi:MAG TPA: GNAT family N-acetyltransferase [Candidatus Paceibacterota bacterium]|jgi:ASC-1-like (ASCH) protein/ribosomal protein S18 acetylase RimI-like enzyme|nr:GNAT family N-acetyltransferase [Candidatus Paceibacterota bacterium]
MTTEKAEVVIREAVESDSAWVSDLMQDALEPFYGGDHRAHAKRILEAHLSGGMDLVGFFSFEQRMFIVEVNGVRAGMIHLVGKRQETYKISPLILASEFRGKLGIGSVLLKHAEQYARDHNARQLYCTVAESNVGAMQFFLRKGFVRAGSSASHYKAGVVETMLYKILYEAEEMAAYERVHISVIPLEEKHEAETSKLLLTTLPESFGGVDENWIKALYGGYARRHIGDINVKFKLIYVAVSGTGEIVGVAGMTPKKGEPIKVMPFIAKGRAAFDALLVDLPHQLVQYGRKLYIHINPTASEVVSLQRFGWKLDAAMPSAYRPGVITYQWSLEIGATTMREMRVKPRFINLARSRKKTLEVRVGYDNINRIQVGERIRFVSHESTLDIRVKAIRRYPTIALLLDKEPWEKIAPDLSSKEETFQLLKQIYPSEKEKLGMVVLEIDPL